MAVVAAPFARYHDLYDSGRGSGRAGRKNRFLIRSRRKKFNCDPLLWRYIRLDQWLLQSGIVISLIWTWTVFYSALLASHSDSPTHLLLEKSTLELFSVSKDIVCEITHLPSSWIMNHYYWLLILLMMPVFGANPPLAIPVTRVLNGQGGWAD